VKILLFAEQAHTLQALTAFFDHRRRAYIHVPVADLTADGLPDFLHREQIDLVLNVASLCLLEQRPDGELVKGVETLAAICEREGVALMQLSNSQVFDGLDGGRHKEQDEVVPASRMGSLSWQMEQAIRKRCSRHIILRVPELIGAVGDNALTDVLQHLQAGGELSASTAGKCAPVLVDDFSRVVSAIIDQLSCGADVWGTYHYSSTDPVSYHDFVDLVQNAAADFLPAEHCQLLPINTADTSWPKPLLNCDKTHNTFGIKQLPWRAAIVPAVQRWFSEQEQP
jgi:dTDP-4-dehydrorhamnose reductase